MAQSLSCFRFYLAYTGTEFAGFQAQANARTVSQEFAQALYGVVGQKPLMQAAGRTDAGVHARGQVISANFATKLSTRQLTLALATKTPKDLCVWRIDNMPLGFDARRHSIGKQYIYTISQGLVADLASRPYAWHVRRPLDIMRMKHAANFLLGEHDFESFRNSLCSAAHALRYIWAININKKNQLIEIDIRGNAFCLNMVRIIVGTLVEIGSGKRSVESMHEILVARDRKKAGITAKAQGLNFNRVYYPDDLSDAHIPEEAIFPRYPVSESSWPFKAHDIKYGPT